MCTVSMQKQLLYDDAGEEAADAGNEDERPGGTP